MHKPFNDKGLNKGDIYTQFTELAANDAKWKQGRTFSLVFYPGEEVSEVLFHAYKSFFFENGLNPSVFRSLKQMENEVVSMTLNMLHGPEGAVGNMTSGGTESILCAVKAAKKYWRDKKPRVTHPNIVMPQTAHPAFYKAADYFDLEVRAVPCIGEGLVPDMAKYEALIDENTAIIVGSAPAYPHGTIDPLEEINKLAAAKDVWFHIDACVGGYMIPFLEQIGEPVPVFDFRLSNATSISLDIHKYGYGPKGSSVVAYRDSAHRRKQYFVQTDWPGGLYVSPSISGTRPGGAIAGSWAVMNYMGQEGYRNYAAKTIEAAKKIQNAINAIDGLKVVGNPLTTVFSFMSTGKYDIYRLGDELSALGWHVDRQLVPASLHLTVSYGNVAFADDFVRDLNASVAKLSETSIGNIADGFKQGLVKQAVKLLPESIIKKITAGSINDIPNQKDSSGKTAPLYGLMGELSGTGTLEEMVLDLLDAMNRLPDKKEEK